MSTAYRDSVSSSGLFPCPTCDQPFHSEIAMNNHLADTHYAVYTCNACGDKFRTEADFISHVAGQHMNGKEVETLVAVDGTKMDPSPKTIRIRKADIVRAPSVVRSQPYPANSPRVMTITNVRSIGNPASQLDQFMDNIHPDSNGEFTCPTCKETSPFKPMLRQHVAVSHLRMNALKCHADSVCQSTYKVPGNVRTHIAMSHMDNFAAELRGIKSCTECGARMYAFNAVLLHYLVKHMDKMIQLYRSRPLTTNKESIPAGGVLFEGPEANSAANEATNGMYLEEAVEPPQQPYTPETEQPTKAIVITPTSKPFSCPSCPDKDFFYKEFLQQHNTTVHGSDNRNVCTFCSKPVPAELQGKHLVTNHMQGQVSSLARVLLSLSDNEAESRKCPICCEQCHNVQAVARHMMTSHAEDSYNIMASEKEVAAETKGVEEEGVDPIAMG